MTKKEYIEKNDAINVASDYCGRAEDAIDKIPVLKVYECVECSEEHFDTQGKFLENGFVCNRCLSELYDKVNDQVYERIIE